MYRDVETGSIDRSVDETIISHRRLQYTCICSVILLAPLTSHACDGCGFNRRRRSVGDETDTVQCSAWLIHLAHTAPYGSSHLISFSAARSACMQSTARRLLYSVVVRASWRVGGVRCRDDFFAARRNASTACCRRVSVCPSRPSSTSRYCIETTARIEHSALAMVR